MNKKVILTGILLSSIHVWSFHKPDSIFLEVCGIIQKNFYCASFVQDSLPIISKEYLVKFKNVKLLDFKPLMERFLMRLGSSHTEYLTPQDPHYYQLAATFRAPDIKYPTIGVVTKGLDNRTYVISVLPGGAAEKAGLLFGDEILSVNGKPYQAVESFRVKNGSSVKVKIRRGENIPDQTIDIIPELLDPIQESLRAQELSMRIDTIHKHKIGYIHIYHYGGSQFQESLENALLWGELHNADAVLIDLRFGLGGADPSYLRLFDKQIPVLTSVAQDGSKKTYDPQWRKPVAYLVDRSSRSGKEILAYAARKYGHALVLGDTTAGAVLGGSLFSLSNGDRLYLAVMDVSVDGERLEGRGVVPDVWIPWDLKAQHGKDLRILRAMEILAKRLD